MRGPLLVAALRAPLVRPVVALRLKLVVGREPYARIQVVQAVVDELGRGRPMFNIWGKETHTGNRVVPLMGVELTRVTELCP